LTGGARAIILASAGFPPPRWNRDHLLNRTGNRSIRHLITALTAAVSLTAPLRAGSPFLDPVFGTHQTSNIQYGSGLISGGASSFNLTLDLIQPTNIGVPVPATSPGIVLIHGGSFTTGDKTDLDSLAATYASYGYTVASINYRLIGQNPPSSSPGPADNLVPPPPPFVTLPNPQGINEINAAVQDAQAAMGWMRDNAALFHIDPNRIGIGGVSAGAIDSLLEAYNNPPAQFAPAVVLDFLGSMYGTAGVIHAGDPPAFVVHGTVDTTVPFSGDQAVVNQLNAVGVYNEFYPEPGLGHTVDFTQINNGNTLLENNMLFLAHELAGVPEPSSLVLAAMGLLALLSLSRRRFARVVAALR
jgi:acetyl esterase/lipase